MTANWDPAFLGLFLVLFAAVAAFAAAFPQGDRRWWALFGLLALLVLVDGLGLPSLLCHLLPQVEVQEWV